MEKPTRLALLKEIAEYLNIETEMQSMMEGALRRLVNGSDFTTGWIFFINDRGEHELVSHVDLPKSLERNECHYMSEGPCWCVQSYHNKKLHKASNIINCSRIQLANKSYPYTQQQDEITHHATVPLQSGTERFGLLNVATPNTTRYSDEDLELLESVAFQIGSSIKRIILTNQEKEAARISERNRLARDLHDSVNQMLFSLKLTAHAAIGLAENDRLKQALHTIEDTSQQAVNEMRALIWQLKPIGLEQGLVYALKQYSNVLQLQLEISVDGLIDLPNTIEAHSYHIIQEAMNNTKKYAGVNVFKLSLKQQRGAFIVHMHDSGSGFNVDQHAYSQSHGIGNMRYRVREMNGNINITSQLGEGTDIHISIPID